ncbi:uncharacterized protein BX664DRAFT_200396 [Halteromyces radiatus]|uniref:uncharacterized protein n=1 Tax=Halteromyces radiatus TaxID=101107 RepID=UPI0022200514|nr:uncharacterized protein BX664DRAFT_200396 [Halteromyces radiatus]KAI8081758.1 hypothetical protein BX664DRAFT_200396 [Halteromyces radiatus]
MNNAINRIQQLTQRLADTHDNEITESLYRISENLYNLLRLHQDATDLVVEVANGFGLQMELNDERWDTAVVNSLIATLQTTMEQRRVAEEVNIQHHDLETQELLDMMDLAAMEIPRLMDDLNTHIQQHTVSFRQFDQARQLYFGNDEFGNQVLMNTIIDHCQQAGAPITVLGTHIQLSTAYISRHCDIFTKYAFNIAVYFDEYNNATTNAANPVQTKVPRTWCFEKIRDLDDYPRMGRRRRSKLATLVQEIIPKNDNLDHHRHQLEYLSDESMTQLQTLITDTRQQILCSTQYLENPQENQHLLPNCFTPDVNHVIKKKRLYNLVPKPSFVKKHIKINSTIRNQILRSLDLGHYVNGNSTLSRVLKLEKIRRHDSMVFSNYIMTDGFSVSVPFDKPVGHGEALPDLVPADFCEWEFDYLNVWGADPGITSIYVASNGSSNDVYDSALDHEGKWLSWFFFFFFFFFFT